ncbi:hypothetical protein N7501_008072 [Penicillium viridicatum]|nr:hypothetical protein N7501_008072 [Penicillium viridicatum]
MANNNTNIISIIVNPLPPAPQPTSTPQSSPSPSERSIREKVVSMPAFWAFLAVALVCIFGGAGYFLWRWLASKKKGSEGIPLHDIGTGEQRGETSGDPPAGDNVDGRRLGVALATPTTPTTPQNPQTPTPPKKKKRKPNSSELANRSTVVRNTFHGAKDLFVPNSPAGVAVLSG